MRRSAPALDAEVRPAVDRRHARPVLHHECAYWRGLAAALPQAALSSDIVLLSCPDHIQDDRRDMMRVLDVEGWTHPVEELCVVRIADRSQSPIAAHVVEMLIDQLS